MSEVVTREDLEKQNLSFWAPAFNRVIAESAISTFKYTGLTMRLFGNDHYPGVGDTVADYDETQFIGYSPKPLPGTSWRPTKNSDGSVSIASEMQDFVSTVDQKRLWPVYGFYLTHDSTGELFYATRFLDAPNGIINEKDRIQVTSGFVFGAPNCN